MPYSSNSDLPTRIREGMPEHAQSIFRNVFNSVMQEGDASEASAFAQAYGAVENAGYYQNTEGNWVKEEDIGKFNPHHDARGRFAPGSGGVNSENMISYKSSFEAEVMMSRKYPGKDFSFSGADIKTLNPTLEQYEKLATKFPETAKSFTGISTAYGNVKGEKVQAFIGKDGLMNINLQFYGRPEAFKKSLEDGVKSKFHPKGGDKYEAVLTHEFAHHISNHILINGDSKSKFALTSLQAKLSNRIRASKEISQYAGKDFDEAFAEAFVAYEHGGAKTGLPKLVGDFINKYGK